jgi:hypothetical protein
MRRCTLATKRTATKTVAAPKKKPVAAKTKRRVAPKAQPKARLSRVRKSAALVDFVSLDWRQVAPGAREKGLTRGGVKLRLLELTPEFEEAAWCLKGHAGVVLEGEMELDMPGGPARFGDAQGFILLPGGVDRHRAKALTPEVLLLLVDYV